MKCVLAMLVLFGSSAVPALALPAQPVAPPGNSGVEEHLETVPAAGGDRPAVAAATPTPSAAGGRSSARRVVLAEKTAKALRRLGPDGRAAAALAAAGAPSDAGTVERNARNQAAGSSGPSGSIPARAEGGRARAVAGALAGGGGGLGLAFPLVLLGSLAAAAGLLLIRSRARHG